MLCITKFTFPDHPDRIVFCFQSWTKCRQTFNHFWQSNFSFVIVRMQKVVGFECAFWGFWPFLTGRCFQSRNDSVVVLSRGLVVELSSELSNESLASSLSLSVVSVFNWHVSIGVEELKLWKRIKPNQKSCHRPIFGASSVLEWAEDIMTFREGYYWANSNLSLQDLKYLGLSKPTDVLIDKSTL